MTSLQDYRTIPLTQNQIAKVDVEDYERIAQYKWCAHWVPDSKKFRSVRRLGKGKDSFLVYMHREIMGLSRGDKRLIDHINGDMLDNRKSNLRFADKCEGTAIMMCWHRFTKWQLPEKMEAIYNLVQLRKCEKCGIIQVNVLKEKR
jgi:hypothetical protein